MVKKANYAIGVFVEGTYLHIVSLIQKNKAIRLVDAEITQLQSAGEANSVLSGNGLDAFANESNLSDLNLTDASGEFVESDVVLTDLEEELFSPNEASQIKQFLNKYNSRSLKLAISLAEPNIYYAYFNSDWGLKGQKLNKRIIEELSRLRPDAEMLNPEDINIIKLRDGRLMAVIRDSDIGILAELEAAKPGIIKRISFIESAEISLINLVKQSYQLSPNEISLIIYVGHEFSRLMFLQGGEILNISYIISVGLDSENIVNTIYSRILLEQDNLSISHLDNIILAGQAFDAGIDGFLKERFPSETVIEYINLHHLGIVGSDPLSSRYAIPIGAALRALDQKNKEYYHVDITPSDVRESRKKFKLGVSGWGVMFLIPLFTFFATIKISEQQLSLNQLESQLRSKKIELAELQEIEARLDLMRNRLASFDQKLSVLDSIPLNNTTWSEFLNQIAKVAHKTKYVWITEAAREGTEKVAIKGYSVYRSKIPQFVNSLENARLKKVEVQEIREKTVYNFEVEIVISPKAYAVNTNQTKR